MRYTNTAGTDAYSAFNDGVRPELSKIPKALATLIRERDRVMAQRYAAQDRVNNLAKPEVQHAAQQADDDGAAKAARAGKDIPAAAAVAKLEADRAEAARALEAQDAALAAVTNDCYELASKLYWDNVETLAADRAKIRADIAAKAAALADAVEAAVDSFSVSDWLRSGHYTRDAKTWPTDVVDLRRYGLDHGNTSVINVRDVIVTAATTVLDEPTN